MDFSSPFLKLGVRTTEGVNIAEPKPTTLPWERGQLGIFVHSVDFSILRGGVLKAGHV